jgi:hypothetical protein
VWIMGSIKILKSVTIQGLALLLHFPELGTILVVPTLSFTLLTDLLRYFPTVLRFLVCFCALRFLVCFRA